MGTDIHIKYYDKHDNEITFQNIYGKDFYDDPFGGRSYSVFSFLAGVRNYSAIKPISEPKGRVVKNGDEEDRFGYRTSDPWNENHSHSWLYLKEIVEYDYQQVVNDRRNNGDTLDEEHGTEMPLCEYLPCVFFDDIGRCIRRGVNKIVFSFDS